MSLSFVLVVAVKITVALLIGELGHSTGCQMNYLASVDLKVVHNLRYVEPAHIVPAVDRVCLKFALLNQLLVRLLYQ